MIIVNILCNRMLCLSMLMLKPISLEHSIFLINQWIFLSIMQQVKIRYNQWKITKIDSEDNVGMYGYYYSVFFYWCHWKPHLVYYIIIIVTITFVIFTNKTIITMVIHCSIHWSQSKRNKWNWKPMEWYYYST